MPRLILTQDGADGLTRCRRFLSERNPRAATKAMEAISRALRVLKSAPDIGRPHPEFPTYRELLIGFGDSGYIAVYRRDPATDTVYILAFRHQKEAGY